MLMSKKILPVISGNLKLSQIVRTLAGYLPYNTSEFSALPEF